MRIANTAPTRPHPFFTHELSEANYAIIKMITYIHENLIFPARIKNLSAALGKRLPIGSSLLDVGCGDGQLAELLHQQRQLKRVEGVDVLLRPNVAIPAIHFNGTHIPYPDRSWDYVMAVDVLHHAEQQQALLHDMLRVADKGVLIKDHLCENQLDYWLLRKMDNVGNERHGVAVPGKYFSKSDWLQLFTLENSSVAYFCSSFRLYPWPLSFVFGRKLHCIIMLHLNRPENFSKS